MMNNLIKIKLLFALILMSFNQNLNAQCSGCTTTVTPGVASYTAISGQTLCVAGGVNYTGTLVLNGGTICNSGTINNITFLKGTFLNYGTYNTGNVSMNITANVNIENYNGSRINMGSLTFSATAATRILALNIYKGSTATFTSSILKNAGVINIEVGRSNPGGNPVAASTLNVNSLFTVKNDNFSLLIQSEATVNLIDIFSLESTGVKSVTNYGNLNLSRDLNMISAGSASSTVTINNYKEMTLRSLSASYTVGKVFINNNAPGSMTVTSSLTLSKNTNTLTNTGNLNISSNFNIQDGLAANSGTITNNNFTASGGVFTNNRYIKSTLDFLSTSTVVTVNNNGYINVLRDFNNIAVTNLAQKSLITTNNFYNLGNSANINGPSSAPDTISYAKIIITNTSQCTGYMSGKIIVHDQSLTSNASNVGYGFDQVTNGSRISNTVLFASKVISEESAPIVNCRAMLGLYQISFVGTIPYQTCPNKTFTMQAQAQNIVTTTSGTIAVNYALSDGSYTWQPSALTGTSISTTVSVNTTFTVFATLPNGCVISNTVSVICDMTGAPTINYPGSPYTYVSPGSLTFPVTLTNPFSGSVYSAIPAGLNINSSTGLVTATGSSFGTYTVSYTTPVTGNCFTAYTTKTIITLLNATSACSVSPGFGPNLEPYLCEGDQVQLYTTGIANSYAWTPTVGLSCTNCPSPILTFTPSVTVYTLNYSVNSYNCPLKTITIFKKMDCADNSIVGCCFSNYGVSVYVDKATTYLNVYCNVVNEISNLVLPTTVSKGKFESTGNINLTKDWIHNGQNKLFEIPYAFSLNPLAVRQGTTSFIGNNNQNIRGNSNTYFNKLILAGNGKRTIWINTYATSDLDLTSNEFVIQGFNFLMKNENANVFRTSGYASSLKTGYFSRVLAATTNAPNKTYLFPLGSPASLSTLLRYRPLELMNNKTTLSDEVSANFVNQAPALADGDFVNANYAITNIVTDKSPSIIQRNGIYYHKLKNTQTSALLSNIIVRSFFPAIDGNYNSLSEWQSSVLLGPDWWGLAPGVFSNYSISSNPGTFGMVYAAANGTLNFQGKPFSIASTGININTTSFIGNGNVITLTSSPSTGTSISTNTITTNNTPVINTTTTNVIGGGVSTSTTNSTDGSVTTNTTAINSGVTTQTTVVTSGPNTTIITTATSSGIGGTTTNTIVTVTGAGTTITTTTTTPTTGGVSSNTT
ncbi:MAG: hypothetical protein H0W73_19820, partial [Bacteroidetes bacterium]|nr:hypothetical protein [Bacteroidota bacterium]